MNNTSLAPDFIEEIVSIVVDQTQNGRIISTRSKLILQAVNRFIPLPGDNSELIKGLIQLKRCAFHEIDKYLDSYINYVLQKNKQ